MDDTNKTPSDAKVEPKVTLEKACQSVEAEVTALLSKTVKGFELDPADKKSRKRIFEAFVKTGAQYFVGSEGMKLSSLSRRASLAFYDRSTPPPKSNLTAIDGGLDDNSSDGDDEQDDDT